MRLGWIPLNIEIDDKETTMYINPADLLSLVRMIADEVNLRSSKKEINLANMLKGLSYS